MILLKAVVPLADVVVLTAVIHLNAMVFIGSYCGGSFLQLKFHMQIFFLFFLLTSVCLAVMGIVLKLKKELEF